MNRETVTEELLELALAVADACPEVRHRRIVTRADRLASRALVRKNFHKLEPAQIRLLEHLWKTDDDNEREELAS
jgi:hypothetical protein